MYCIVLHLGFLVGYLYGPMCMFYVGFPQLVYIKGGERIFYNLPHCTLYSIFVISLEKYSREKYLDFMMQTLLQDMNKIYSAWIFLDRLLF
jgi:hypothetical protein